MKNILIYILPFFILGCGKSELKPSDFKAHVENSENGFVQKIDAAPYVITCMYMPAAYMTINHFRKNNIKEEEFHKQEKGYEEFDLYRLEISSDDNRNLNGLEEYFGFYMQEGIFKVAGTDTLPCIVYHAEPFSTVQRRQRIELGFSETQGIPTQVILKKTPFSIDDIKFSFNKPEIFIPTVKLD